MNLTPEQKEHINTARAVLDAIESGGEIEVRRDKGPSGLVWYPEPALGCLNVLSYYRVKPTPVKVPYTVAELLELGIHYVMSGGAVWTIRTMNTVLNTLAADNIEYEPEWFACRGFLWSADGKNWNNFRKEKQ